MGGAAGGLLGEYVRRGAETDTLLRHLTFAMDFHTKKASSGNDAVENVPVQYFGTGIRAENVFLMKTSFTGFLQ